MISLSWYEMVVRKYLINLKDKQMTGRNLNTNDDRIIDHTKDKDVYGLLAKGVLPAGTLTPIYTAGESSEYINIYFNITNANALDTAVTIYIGRDNTPTLQDLLEIELPIKSKLTYIRGPVTISKGEKIFLLSTIADTVYRLYGYDERKF